MSITFTSDEWYRFKAAFRHGISAVTPESTLYDTFQTIMKKLMHSYTPTDFDTVTAVFDLDKKSDEIHRIVEMALRAQDVATYNGQGLHLGPSSVDIANEILRVLKER